METAPLWIWASVLALSLTISLAVVPLILPRRRPKPNDLIGANATRDPVFLFDGETMLDASWAGERLISRKPGDAAWEPLVRELTRYFPEFPSEQDKIRQSSPLLFSTRAESGPAEVLAEWVDGLVRIHIRSARAGRHGYASDPLRLHAAETQAREYEHAVENSPCPVWKLSASDELIWSNQAYKKLQSIVAEPGTDPDTVQPFKTACDDDFATGTKRVCEPLIGSDEVVWYDLSVSVDGPDRVFHATDVGAIIHAEDTQRTFVQTLAKTFAQLSVGLAIFDRRRQLILFNPALIDLTALPADFLSIQPNLLAFFDRLREAQIMPEPKDYKSWRHQMAAVIDAAAEGKYSETWTLPSGAVYRVTGRPHPDKAVAFLFEDITSEVTLTRRFRDELNVAQSVIDRLDDAIAVFSRSGSLTTTNARYRRLWSVNYEESFAETTVLDASRVWQEASEASPLWGDLRDYVTRPDQRTDWSAGFLLKSGIQMECFVSPLDHGATLVRFRELPLAEDNAWPGKTVQSVLP